MTAPDTNLKKQKKQHKAPLIGIGGAVGVAVLLLVWMLSRTLVATPETETAPAISVDGPPTAPLQAE